MTILDVDNINTYYGNSHVLHGISLEINEGEVVTLLGRNGAGKTTTMRSIVGASPPRTGSITYRGGRFPGSPRRDQRTRDLTRPGGPAGVSYSDGPREPPTRAQPRERPAAGRGDVRTVPGARSVAEKRRAEPQRRRTADGIGRSRAGTGAGARRAPCWTSPPRDSRRSSSTTSGRSSRRSSTRT